MRSPTDQTILVAAGSKLLFFKQAALAPGLGSFTIDQWFYDR